MDKSKKASKYLRECREITTSCCSKLIKAQAALNQSFLAMQEKMDKLSEKDEKEIDAEMEKMKTTLASLIKSTNELEVKWLRGVQDQEQVKCRADKGRKARIDNDSGFISAGSAMMHPEDKEPSSIIAQATKEPEDKHCSDSFAISLPGAINPPSIEVTQTTDDSKCDLNMLELAPMDLRLLVRSPSEHADTDSLLTSEDPLDASSRDALTGNYLQKSDSASGSENHENVVMNTNNTDLDKTEQIVAKKAQCVGQEAEAASSEEVRDKTPVRASGAFAAKLGEDKHFLQMQGNHQKRRIKKNEKSNTF